MYNIEDIKSLKLKFEKKILDKAQVFFNLLKYTFTKRPIQTDIQNWSTYNYILNKEYNFNKETISNKVFSRL